MVTLLRDELRRFRSVLRRCRQPRAADAQVLRVVAAGNSVRLVASTPEATLGHARESDGDTVCDADWCLPASLLDLAEATAADRFELTAAPGGRVRLRWPGGAEEFEVLRAQAPAWPDGPER